MVYENGDGIRGQDIVITSANKSEVWAQKIKVTEKGICDVLMLDPLGVVDTDNELQGETAYTQLK